MAERFNSSLLRRESRTMTSNLGLKKLKCRTSGRVLLKVACVLVCVSVSRLLHYWFVAPSAPPTNITSPQTRVGKGESASRRRRRRRVICRNVCWHNGCWSLLCGNLSQHYWREMCFFSRSCATRDACNRVQRYNEVWAIQWRLKTWRADKGGVQETKKRR